MKRTYAILTVSWIFMSSMQAHAVCMQGHPSVRLEYSESDQVVLATVKSLRYVRDPRDQDEYEAVVYHISVQRVHRGDASKALDIYSINTSARFPMGIGERYLLFIHDDPQGKVVSPCGNSGLVSESQKALSEVLVLSRKNKRGRKTF